MTKKPPRRKSKVKTRRYVSALAHADADDLHEAVAKRGLSLLEQEVPYIVTAARLARRGLVRKEARRAELLRSGVLPQPWDPFERLVTHAETRRLLEALASLPDEEVLVLSGWAQDMSPDEVMDLWRRMGFQPDPSAAFIRKRRQRAVSRLRAMLTASGKQG